MNKTFWNYIKKHPFVTVIVLAILTTAVLHLIGVLLFEYWTGNKQLNTNNDFDILGGVISYFTGVLSVIAIIFLYINYHQVKEQNDKNNQDSEFNRALEITHKHIEYIKTSIKDDNLLKELNKEMDNDEISDFHNVHKIFLNSSVYKVYECLSAITIIIHTSNLTIENKNYILKLSTLAIGKTLLNNINSLRQYSSKNTIQPATSLYISILLIESLCTPINKENEDERISIAKGHLNGFK